MLGERPELASATGLFDSLSVMHRAAAGGHVRVLRAVVESLRAYGSHVADPSKADHKVRTSSPCQLEMCTAVRCPSECWLDWMTASHELHTWLWKARYHAS